MEKIYTYSLKINDKNSDQYYLDIEQFTNRLMTKAENVIGEILDRYIDHLDRNNVEELRSWEEYLFDLLMTGVFWNNYSLNSIHLNKTAKILLLNLANIRNRVGAFKPGVDYVRGILMTLLLKKFDVAGSKPLVSEDNIQGFLDWLMASNEFKHELKRITQFTDWLSNYDQEEVERIFTAVIKFADWFESESLLCLGKYTKNVQDFIAKNREYYYWREDSIFCTRKRNEYHLNMTGAEIMNRAFRIPFVETKYKTILVPACMRDKSEDECQMIKDGLDQICTGCTKNCNINKITSLGKKEGFDVYIVPHSSSFSAWLTKWSGNDDIGIVAVACPLNLVAGGLEIKNLGIKAQCVLLDYCGCKNHWDREGQPTNLNLNEVKNIISKN
jgi:uncharacterized protein